MKKLILHITFFLFLIQGFFVLGVNDDRQIDRKKWNEIRDGIRYEGTSGEEGQRWTYTPDERKALERGSNESESGNSGRLRRMGRNSGRDYSTSESSSESEVELEMSNDLATLLYIIVIALLIGIVLYLILKKYMKNPRLKKTIVSEDKSPEQISLSELKQLLNKALAEENYREAIRIYFIFIIKELSERKWINWQKEKTNLAYLREMRNQPHFESFKRTSQIFEVVWYGDKKIEKTHFESLEPYFKEMHKTLNIE